MIRDLFKKECSVKKLYMHYLLLLSLLTLSSCIKTYKMLKNETPQGKEQPRNDKLARNNIRTVMAFEEWSKRAHFDILWCSDEMYEAYAKLDASFFGKNNLEQQATLKRKLNENKNSITCYLLAEIDGNDYTLKDEQSEWTTYLLASDGEMVRPNTLDEVDGLDPVIKRIFYHRYTNHKTPYIVKFPARDMHGNRYVTREHPLRIVMSSTWQKVIAQWGPPVKESKKREATCRYVRTTPPNSELLDEDFYDLR